MFPKTVVYGFDIDGDSFAYSEDLLREHGTYQHEIDGEAAAVTMQDDGSVILELGSSDARYAPIRLFWFAWYTFHPKTQLFQ